MTTRGLLFIVLVISSILYVSSVDCGSYSRCIYKVFGSSNDIFWNVTNSALLISVRTPYTGASNYYLGMGYSQGGDSPMIGSYALIGCINNDGTNRHLKTFLLKARSPDGMTPTADFTSSSSIANDGKYTTITYSRSLIIPPLPPIQVDGTGTNVVFAIGPYDIGNDRPNHHDQAVYGSINFVTGDSAIGSSPAKTAHAVLMALSFAVIFPLGIIIARFGKNYKPLWYNLHVLFQCVGLLLSTIGFCIGVFKIGTGTYPKHFALGVTIMVLTWLQPLNTLIRPHAPNPGEAISEKRKIWNYVHWSTGRAIVIMAVFQIFLGLEIFSSSRSWVMFYEAVLILMIILFVFLQIRLLWSKSHESLISANSSGNGSTNLIDDSQYYHSGEIQDKTTA